MKLADLFESLTEPKVINLLKTGAQPFLRQNSGPLWRGIHLEPSAYTVEQFDDGSQITWALLKQRTNRGPLTSDAEIHKAADDWFEEKFGWRARSTGTFVTGRKTEAASYGRTHLIYPLGEFNFVWSPIIHDLYSSSWSRLTKDDSKLTADKAKKLVASILDNGEYQNSDLHAAVRRGHEIMLDCKSYIAINVQRTDRNALDELEGLAD